MLCIFVFLAPSLNFLLHKFCSSRFTIMRISSFVLLFSITHLINSLSPPPLIISYSSFYSTTTRQFGNLCTIPLSFFLFSPLRKLLYPKSCTLLFLILLSGDIHINPGPSPLLNICTLNIQSFLNPLHYTALHDLAQTHPINIFALTET